VPSPAAPSLLRQKVDVVKFFKVIWLVIIAMILIASLALGFRGDTSTFIFFLVLSLPTVWLFRGLSKRQRTGFSALAIIVFLLLSIYSATPQGRAARNELNKEEAATAAADAKEQATDAQAAKQMAENESNMTTPSPSPLKNQGGDPPDNAPQNQPSTTTATSSDDNSGNNDNGSSTVVGVGYDGYLTMGGGDVVVATTEDNLKQLTDAAAANDNVGIQKMIDNGDAFTVPDGTRCKLLAYSGFLDVKCHVRIEGGDHDTDDGWVPQELLKK
jgi:hypothetical protein